MQNNKRPVLNGGRLDRVLLATTEKRGAPPYKNNSSKKNLRLLKMGKHVGAKGKINAVVGEGKMEQINYQRRQGKRRPIRKRRRTLLSSQPLKRVTLLNSGKSSLGLGNYTWGRRVCLLKHI